MVSVVALGMAPTQTDQQMVCWRTVVDVMTSYIVFPEVVEIHSRSLMQRQQCVG